MVYSAIFVMASALTSRAIAIGLLYVLIWEGLLSNVIGGVRILSAGHYALGIANGIADEKSDHFDRDFGIRPAGETGDGFGLEPRPSVRNIEAAVAGKTREHSLGKAEGGGLAPG